MDDHYLPASDFIWMAANGDVPLAGGDAGDHNLKLLIAFTRDQDVSNRDWATMTLAMQEIDTLEVRDALLGASQDSDVDVRAEALAGLALRDTELALPFIERELRKTDCGYGTFEAARLTAHPLLLDGLRAWVNRGGTPSFDALINDAITACEAALTEGH